MKGFGGRLAWAGSAHGDARMWSSQRESGIGELPVSVFEGQAVWSFRQCCVCPSSGRSVRLTSITNAADGRQIHVCSFEHRSLSYRPCGTEIDFVHHELVTYFDQLLLRGSREQHLDVMPVLQIQ